MKFLCSIGIHIPIKKIGVLFRDVVSGKDVNHYKCSCGLDWMANSIFSGIFFKVKK